MSGGGFDTAARGEFTPLNPARIVDTRTGLGGLPRAPIGPGATIDATVTGVGGVPPSGVSGVIINVTVTQPTAGSFVSVFPAGQARPNSSTLNFAAGQTIANLTVAAVGDAGRVSIYNDSGAAHVVIDVVGWISTATATGGGLAGRYRALSPQRVLDTRSTNTPLAPNTVRTLSLAGVAGIPSDARSVALNLTATGATAGTFITAFPANEPLPVASSVNVDAGRTVANLAVVKLGAGAVAFYNLAGSVHLVVDVAGYFVDDYSSTRGMIAPVSPERVLDTRQVASPLGPDEIGSLFVSSNDVDAFVLNVTVTQPSAGGYVTVFPDEGGNDVPLASNLNFSPGQTVPNLVFVPASTGSIGFYSEFGTVHVVADVVAVVTR